MPALMESTAHWWRQRALSASQGIGACCGFCLVIQDGSDRKWRNNMRTTLVLFKRRQPSTSPWCPWANDPLEPEHISADWQPPPPATSLDNDDPPFWPRSSG
jgi:hypothetical protein